MTFGFNSVSLLVGCGTVPVQVATYSSSLQYSRLLLSPYHCEKLNRD
jgi:hypothetical protein